MQHGVLLAKAFLNRTSRALILVSGLGWGVLECNVRVKVWRNWNTHNLWVQLLCKNSFMGSQKVKHTYNSGICQRKIKAYV